jgi:hypothetical protein
LVSFQTGLVGLPLTPKGLYNNQLPSITAGDLLNWQKTAGIESPLTKQEDKNHIKKFFTKSALVITALITPSVLTPKILNKFPGLSKALPKGVTKLGLPIAIGMTAGTTLSLVLQSLVNGGVDKEHLVSDLKDVFLTTVLASSFNNIISGTNRLLSSYWIMSYKKSMNRFLINGVVGGSYAFLRGIIKPEKEDKLSLKNVTKGFVEGIFLGEGARILFKTRPGSKVKSLGLYNFIKYSKICLGAALGSLAFRFADYFTEKTINPQISKTSAPIQKEYKKIIEHLFKGNSYPTIIG